MIARKDKLGFSALPSLRPPSQSGVGFTFLKAPSPRELPAKRGEGVLTLGFVFVLALSYSAASAAGTVWRGKHAPRSTTLLPTRRKNRAPAHLPRRGRLKRHKSLFIFYPQSRKSQFLIFPRSSKSPSIPSAGLLTRLPRTARAEANDLHIFQRSGSCPLPLLSSMLFTTPTMRQTRPSSFAMLT